MNTKSPARLDRDDGPWRRVRRWLVLAPHPDDFDVVAVTMRQLSSNGAEILVEVLNTGASGVQDEFAATWEAKTTAREAEQIASCRLFGLKDDLLRFHRFSEDDEGHMRDNSENSAKLRAILDRVAADGVVLPHGCDSNADHQRTFRIFDGWARQRREPVLALLIRDPKTLSMRLDVVMPFSRSDADWKARILRCHDSQHQRNLRTRGAGFDDRILQVNRQIAKDAGLEAEFAEGFEIASYGGGRI